MAKSTPIHQATRTGRPPGRAGRGATGVLAVPARLPGDARPVGAAEHLPGDEGTEAAAAQAGPARRNLHVAHCHGGHHRAPGRRASDRESKRSPRISAVSTTRRAMAPRPWRRRSVRAVSEPRIPGAAPVVLDTTDARAPRRVLPGNCWATSTGPATRRRPPARTTRSGRDWLVLAASVRRSPRLAFQQVDRARPLDLARGAGRRSSSTST